MTRELRDGLFVAVELDVTGGVIGDGVTDLTRQAVNRADQGVKLSAISLFGQLCPQLFELLTHVVEKFDELVVAHYAF